MIWKHPLIIMFGTIFFFLESLALPFLFFIRFVFHNWFIFVKCENLTNGWKKKSSCHEYIIWVHDSFLVLNVLPFIVSLCDVFVSRYAQWLILQNYAEILTLICKLLLPSSPNYNAAKSYIFLWDFSCSKESSTNNDAYRDSTLQLNDLKSERNTY